MEEPKVGKLFSFVSRSAYAQYIQEKEETGNEKNREEGVFGPAVGDDKRKIVEAEQSVVVVKLLKVK